MNRRKQRDELWVYKIPLKNFDPLISFAKEDLRKENWQEALCKAMGEERSSLVKYTVEGKCFEESMWHSDIYPNLSERLGYGTLFPADKLEEIVSKIEEAIIELKPDPPKITGQEPMLENVKELQKMIKEVLDLLVQAGLSARNNDNWIRLSGRELNFWGLSSTISNSEQYNKVCNVMRHRFGKSSLRRAIVDMNGFLVFDDMGEDASKTLSWMLSGLINLVFDNQNSFSLKKCLWCEKYFIHPTKRQKKYCSDNCRYDFHNKGQ